MGEGNIEYPEQAATIRLLKFLYRTLHLHWGRGDASLRLWIQRSARFGGFFRDSKHDVEAGVYFSNPHKTPGQQDTSGTLGFRPAEFALRLASLEQSGYVSLTWEPSSGEAGRRGFPMYKSPSSSNYVDVDFVTEAGLVVIGELPDPQAQLIRGFEAAIEAIKYDRSLTDREKRRYSVATLRLGLPRITLPRTWVNKRPERG